MIDKRVDRFINNRDENSSKIEASTVRFDE